MHMKRQVGPLLLGRAAREDSRCGESGSWRVLVGGLVEEREENGVEWTCCSWDDSMQEELAVVRSGCQGVWDSVRSTAARG